VLRSTISLHIYKTSALPHMLISCDISAQLRQKSSESFNIQEMIKPKKKKECVGHLTTMFYVPQGAYYKKK